MAMQMHRFGIGDRVNFVGRVRIGAATGEYEVVRLLPVESGQVLYRIKSVLERHERVVGEEHLMPHGLRG
jgi:hypothetical protein